MSTKFDPELWRRADKVLDKLLLLPADQRRARLEAMSLESDLRARVESLLEAAAWPGLLDAESIALLGAGDTPSSAGLQGRQFGRYRLETLIGHGGMSTVYRARRIDNSFDEAVAVKVLNSALLATDWKDRFQREARYLARLRHPGIATLLDAGVAEDGTPYLVTELVEGSTIGEHCRRAGLDIRARVKLMVELCRAVAFAQNRLIVHRDIKPENVLVTNGGRVKLMDFGIAKPLAEDGEDRATMTRAFTPGYAAPEQLAGEPVTTATDVFSLGAVLYRLLTGQSPFDDTRGVSDTGTPVVIPSKRTETLNELPVSERKQAIRLLRGDLDNIVRKALDENPGRRYPNAETMGEDLRAWLEHRPVIAAAPGLVYHARLFAKRRPALSSALVAVLLVGTAGLAGSLWQAAEARRQAEQALNESQHARAVSDFMVQLFEANDPDIAQGRMPTARELLDVGAHQLDSSFAERPALRARTLVLLGHLYSRIGEYDQARPRLAEGASLSEAAGDPDTHIDALYRAGQLEIESGQLHEALALLGQAEKMLATSARIPGRRHAQVLRSLVAALGTSGSRPEALVRAEEALALARRTPALPQAALADYLFATVDALTGNEQPDRAESLLREAMALDAFQSLAPSYRISALTQLCDILVLTGRYDKALVIQRQVMDLADLIYTRDHIGRALVLQDLGQLLGELGQIDQGLAALYEALEIMEDHFPNESLELAYVHANLGTTLYYGQQFQHAEPHMRRATLIAGELLGFDDPEYATLLLNLSTVLSALENHAEATSAIHQALEVRLAAFGPEHPVIGQTHVYLVNPYIALGRSDDALSHAESALRIYRTSDWDSSRDLFVALSMRARTLEAAEDHDQTHSAYLEALAFGEANRADIGVQWPALLERYAGFLTELNAPEAPSMALRALEAHRETYGPDHPSTQRIAALIEGQRSED